MTDVRITPIFLCASFTCSSTVAREMIEATSVITTALYMHARWTTNHVAGGVGAGGAASVADAFSAAGAAAGLP